MAGDRGFLFPELTASATQPEAMEVKQRKYEGYYSSTKTCEMALSEAVKENYESILYLADEGSEWLGSLTTALRSQVFVYLFGIDK